MKRSSSPAQTVSPVQTQALQTSQQQQNQQQGQINNANATVGQAKSTIASTAPTLNRVTQMDSQGTTPLRKALTTSLTSSTNSAYNNAAANTRRNALTMGLQDQPVTAGNVAASENQRAGALAKIPSEVEQQAAPEEMQAAGLQLQSGSLQKGLADTELSGARVYNPESYFNTGAGLEEQRQGALNTQYEQDQQRKAALVAGLMKAGLSFIPGQYAAG